MTSIQPSPRTASRGSRRRRVEASTSSKRARRTHILGAALIVALALAGCGGSGSSAVVAKVGPYTITKAMFAHAYYIEGREADPASAIPQPPAFTGCIAHLRSVDARSASSGASAPSTATLRKECRSDYQGLETQALDELIIDDWVAGGAVEKHVSVSNQQVQQLLKQQEGKEPAKFVKALATEGRTLADYTETLRVQLLGEGIRQAIREQALDVTPAEVASYYETHRNQFGVPARRDLRIARLGSEAEALKLKREIAYGKSFAAVVKKLPLQRPIYSTDGLVMGYQSGMYSEPLLNDAIFAAKPHVLSRPIHINLGFYIFEVTRTYLAKPESLAQATPAIRKALPGGRYDTSLESFVAAWRTRWTARTSCSAGYVVYKCSQYKPAPGSPPPAADPFTLN